MRADAKERKKQNEIILQMDGTGYVRVLHSINRLRFLFRLSVLKTIVNAETGEIEEVETENEIAERTLTEVGAIDKETYEVLESYLYYKEQVETFKFKLEKAMRENGIKSWKNDYFTATLKDEYMQKRVDADRLKDDGLYEKYLKLVPVKASLQIKFKEK